MSIKIKHILEDLTSKSFKKLVDKLRTLDDQRYRVFVLDAKKLRSSSQNRYYWGVVLQAIAQHTGIEVHEVHEIMKQKFNLKTDHIDGKVYEWGGSTQLLDTKTMSEYIEQIRAWASTELDCYIPEANEMPDELIIELINQGI